MTTLFSQNPMRSRDDVAKAALDMVQPLIARFSPGGARVRLAATGARHDEVSADLEGFARPLWGIAPLAAGGYEFPHWDLWRQGLANGTDPEHPEFWGWPQDIDQRLVEMAALGFALRLVPEHFWHPLSAKAKQNVATYLQMAHGREYPNCNWKFFRILVGLGLSHVGLHVDTSLDAGFYDELDAYYKADGWYFDGKPKQVDHYIPFAFHYYGLLLSALAPDGPRAQVFRDRAHEFATGVQHWYGPDGAALPFGRSLTYRFAHAGIWGAYGFADQPALPWGEIKGLYLRNLRWWADKPIWDNAGLMTVGFAYPNLMMSEGYNGPGSPYWAMKAFLPLALPADHPFWQAEEAAPAAPDVPVALPQAGMVVQRLVGQNIALSSGQEMGYMRHGAEKYAKFAYSTRYGFSIEVDERQFFQASSDNMLSFSDDGVRLRMKETTQEARICGDMLYARWRPYQDVQVETWLVPAGDWHLRLHEVQTPRSLDTIEGGFAIAAPQIGPWGETLHDHRCDLHNDLDQTVILGGDFRKARAHLALPNSNVLHARTIVPQLLGRLEPGKTQLFSAVLAACGQRDHPRPEFPDIAELRDRFLSDSQPVLEPANPLVKIK